MFSKLWNIILLSVFILSTSTNAIILHPQGEPNYYFDRPPDSVVGKWEIPGLPQKQASCTVISPHHVISCKHQGTQTTALITIDCTTYEVEELYVHPTIDLQIARLKNFDSNSFVDLYCGCDELGKVLVIGGFGYGRGEILYNYMGEPYAYEWDMDLDTILRFGTNRVDSVQFNPYRATHTFIFNFQKLGLPGSTIYECATANHDSGAGVFIKDCSTWKLAGFAVALVTDFSDTSIFWYKWPGELVSCEIVSCLRLSPYYNWVMDSTGRVRERGDIDGDCIIGLGDLEVLLTTWLDNSLVGGVIYCSTSDINQDGTVNLLDYAEFVQYWGEQSRDSSE